MPAWPNSQITWDQGSGTFVSSFGYEDYDPFKVDWVGNLNDPVIQDPGLQAPQWNRPSVSYESEGGRVAQPDALQNLIADIGSSGQDTGSGWSDEPAADLGWSDEETKGMGQLAGGLGQIGGASSSRQPLDFVPHPNMSRPPIDLGSLQNFRPQPQPRTSWGQWGGGMG